MKRNVLTFTVLVLSAMLPAWVDLSSQQPPQSEPPNPAGQQMPAGTGTIRENVPQKPEDAPKAPGRPLAGRPIEDFVSTGNTSVARDTIRIYLAIEPGDPYDPVAIQRNFANLWQTGLFDDIRIEAEEGPQGGVVVRVIVSERPRIGAVEYRGNKNLNTSKITDALESANIDVHIGSTIEQTVIRRAAENIRTTYAEGGYEGVTVETLIEDMVTPTEKRIVFVINEGIKARVAAVEFTGNERFSDRTLRGKMKDVKKHNLYTWIRKRNVYTPSKLDGDLELIRNFYQDYGYKDVTFGDPVITTVSKKKKPRVKITVPVNEGVIHTFGSISVDGNEVFNSDIIIGNFPLKEGDVLRRKPIQSRVEAFHELYQRRGYIYAFLDPEYVERENNIVDVKIHVYEGEQFKLGRLEFKGNTTTKDKVLRREIYLEEGDVMDMETFKASMYKLGQLGYFKVTENPDFKVNQGDKTVDITVKGVEEGRNDIQFGGGYSEAYGFFAQFSFSTRNFLGEGESIGVSYQGGRNQDYFSLSYSDPWFMDRPHSFGVSIFNQQATLPDSVGFESTGVGGSVVYGFRLDRFESIAFSYGLQDREEHTEFTPNPDDEGNVPLPSITDTSFVTSTFAPIYRYDSRDNPYDATRGFRAGASFAFTGGILGGTISIWKPELTVTWYKPLSKRMTIGLNTDLGYIIPHGDDDCFDMIADIKTIDDELCVPRSERYFVGGDQSVRGFESYSLGPTETVGNVTSVVGGHKQAIFNAEYLFKITEPLRIVMFADAGQAFARDENFDLSALRYSVGVEARIFLPVFQFPLRFIYAFNPDEKPTDDFDSFRFSIGNTF